MKLENIKPNIVYYTNLIHISFGLKNWQKAIEAFELCQQTDLVKDSFIFSKLVRGLSLFG